jgi:CheY-like chemotaxis protein
MGGEITVTSTVGRGSTFAFFVRLEPGVACPVPDEAVPELPPPPRRPLHILVAEDNEVNIMVTTLRLGEMGHTFVVARTGLEVLERLRRERFDLVLMDIEMPVLDGISATRAIRTSLPDGPISNPAIPIIGVTAHALKEFRDRSLEAGMDDYVSKPVNFHELALIINRLAERTAPGEARPPDSQPRPEPAPEPDTPAETPTDAQWTPIRAMDRLGVDETVFQGFVATAASELAAIAAELRQAVASGDTRTGAALARTVASICTTVDAPDAASAAEAVRTACQAGTGPVAASLLDRLDESLAALLDRLADT